MRNLNRYFYCNSKIYLLLTLIVIEFVAFLTNVNYFDVLIYPVLLFIVVSYLANNGSDYFVLENNGFLPIFKKVFL
jgi:hypothetical protein